MARYDDLNTNMIAYATVLSIVVLVIVLQGTQALTYSMVNYEDARKEVSKKTTHADEMKREQLNSLNGYKKAMVPDLAAADPTVTKQVYMIPISEAKKLVLSELANK